MPIILTIQPDPRDFRSVLAHLAATLDHFILLAPTADAIDAPSNQILTAHNSAFFPLGTIFNLTPAGVLIPKQDPAILFEKFTPESDRKIPPKLGRPRYALRKGRGVWYLIFDYGEAVIRHEQGMFYVVWLLYHPYADPIHALDLMAKVPEIYRQQRAITELPHPTSGDIVQLPSDSRLQQRSLALDDREAMRRHRKQQLELKAELESGKLHGKAKEEAAEKYEQLTNWLYENALRSKDGAHRAAESVRKSIKRVHSDLAATVDPDGAPNPVLRAFADHIDKYILAPSTRRARTGRGATTWEYDPPPGVTWYSTPNATRS